MADQRDVRVFISWSGDLARAVAVGLRDWLPLLSDWVRPWASDTDIAAGQRGLAQIEAELTGTQFGVVVVTAANQHAPWLNFEAGALSKTVAADVEQRVVPLLVDLAGASQLTGPLAQFQAKVADKDGVRDLILSLAAVAGIDERVAAERFDAYWPRLEPKIAAAMQQSGKMEPTQPRREQADVLEEILTHVRQLRSATEPTVTAPANFVGERARQLGRQRLQATDRTIEALAEGHNLRLHGIDKVAGGLEASVYPTGEFSQADVDAFTAELRGRFQGLNVNVTAIPF